jgi:ribosomal protein L7/L12
MPQDHDLHVHISGTTVAETADLIRICEEEHGFKMSAKNVVAEAIHDMWVRKVRPTDVELYDWAVER